MVPSEMRAADDKGATVSVSAAAGSCSVVGEMDFAGFCKQKWGKFREDVLAADILTMPPSHIARIEGALRIAKPTAYGTKVLKELEKELDKMRPRPKPAASFPAPQSEDKGTAEAMAQVAIAEIRSLIKPPPSALVFSQQALQEVMDNIEAIEKIQKHFSSQGNQALRKSAVEIFLASAVAPPSAEIRRLLVGNEPFDQVFPAISHWREDTFNKLTAGAVAKGVSDWSCDACTFKNKGNATKCSICDTAKPLQAEVVPPPLDEGAKRRAQSLAYKYSDADVNRLESILLSGAKPFAFDKRGFAKAKKLELYEVSGYRHGSKYVLTPLNMPMRLAERVDVLLEATGPGDVPSEIIVPYNPGNSHWVAVRIQIGNVGVGGLRSVVISYIDSLRPKEEDSRLSKRQSIVGAMQPLCDALAKKFPGSLIPPVQVEYRRPQIGYIACGVSMMENIIDLWEGREPPLKELGEDEIGTRDRHQAMLKSIGSDLNKDYI